MNMTTIHRSILAYMSTRCDVSSQHKLPGKEELLHSVTLSLFTQDKIIQAIDELIGAGKIFVYGPYISDHAIDVL